MPDPEDPRRISATPARRFFVAMLVKDIELVPSILDLVDNSIDGAKRLRPQNADEAGDGPARFAGLHVRVTVDGERFEIEDNCGGIPLEAARDYAFRFGRPSEIHGPRGEVGQFGVGMKRALFKLGTNFVVTSQTKHDRFRLPVDVAAWSDGDWSGEGDPDDEGDADWSFRLDDFAEDLDVPEDETGTMIVVSPLHEEIAKETGDPTFAGRLLEELRLRHSEAVRHGLSLQVNGTAVEGFEPALLRGPSFEPIHIEREIPAPGGAALHMRLYAGVVRTGDEDADDENAEEFRAPPDAGWYLYCNERLLLAGQTGRLTGWGEPAAAYHPQFRQFRGYVWLDGDAALMPWTTTKTSVDEDSPVFRAVQGHMFDALQKTQAVINRLKRETGSSSQERPAVEAMSNARPVALSAIPRSEAFVVPPPAPRTPTNYRNITYQVDRGDFGLVAAELGTTTAAEVGRRTFDFFLETQVDR